MDRIKKLRNDALNNTPFYGTFHLNFYKEIFKLGETISAGNYSIAYNKAFKAIEPVIDEGELIVGKPVYNKKDESEWNLLKDEVLKKDIVAFVGQSSHMTVDYELLLDKGIIGIISEINNKLDKEEDKDKIEWYRCCIECLNAVLDFSDRYSQKAKDMADLEENADRKKS